MRNTFALGFSLLFVFSMLGIVNTGQALAEGRELTFQCTPVDGVAVDQVKSLDDLTNCGLVTNDSAIPDGKVAIVVIVGDLPVGGNTVRELLAQSSWMNGIVNGAIPDGVVPEDEMWIAHGDVLGTGTCAAVQFHPGDSVTGLSEATWSLWRLYDGSSEDYLVEAEYIREKAERESPPCPWVDVAQLN